MVIFQFLREYVLYVWNISLQLSGYCKISIPCSCLIDSLLNARLSKAGCRALRVRKGIPFLKIISVNDLFIISSPSLARRWASLFLCHRQAKACITLFLCHCCWSTIGRFTLLLCLWAWSIPVASLTLYICATFRWIDWWVFHDLISRKRFLLLLCIDFAVDVITNNTFAPFCAWYSKLETLTVPLTAARSLAIATFSVSQVVWWSIELFYKSHRVSF